MDEQRQKDYLSLINQLLRCQKGEETQILEANSELVDEGLVQIMLQVSNDLIAQGNLDHANSLMNLAGLLTGAYTSTDQDSLNPFIMRVLRATAESKGNSELVYPLLKENLDKLDDNFAWLLQDWGMGMLQDVDGEQARGIAAVIGEFSNLIQQFPLGSKASNTEIAIIGYKIVATVFTREASPEFWATLQNNLGDAYRNRIRGERADNLELAIAAYQNALQVYTRETFPNVWAMTQNNLGLAYSKRIRGERADNLEIAIQAFQNALQVYTREA
ncbi:MAG: tetratricopeptide repeat protein, partial [Coleofasciculaceae cyanobacterium]